MVDYGIKYTVRGKAGLHDTIIGAKDIASAKRKLGKKHGYKDGRMIQIQRTIVLGYY